MLLYSFLLFLFTFGTANGNDVSGALKLGMIRSGSEFFEPIEAGFLRRCEWLGIECYARVSPSRGCEVAHPNITRELIDLGVSGIAIKPCKNSKEVFEDLTAQGVSVLSFDSNVPNSTQIAHVGTDNVFLGRTMARLLRQLRPEGGTYALILPKDGRQQGFEQEIQRYNDRDDRAHWYPVDPVIPHGHDLDAAMKVMKEYAVYNPTAMITMKQTPMRHPNWTHFVDENRDRGITYIGADGADYQLAYLNQRYVDGLVGQLPYEMGTTAAQALYDHRTKGTVEQEIFRTNVVAYNLIPLELPALDYDQNLLGHLNALGFSLFSLTILTAVFCIVWTFRNRKSVVVNAAQPFFLLMVAGGVLVLSSALVPLSFDDGGEPESLSRSNSKAICMSVPWLSFTGFTIIFSALFGKTWRVNRLFQAATGATRIKVTTKEVLTPFVVLMLGNVIVLVCWTVLDPLIYERLERNGTDYWNRVLESYGSCSSENSIRFLVPLGLLNFAAVATASWQAWQARDLKSEFSESKYIGLTVGSVFQAFLTGIPVVAVVRDIPQAYYSLLTLMIFLLCMAVLLLIFLPKMLMHRTYSAMSEAEQRRKLSSRILMGSTRSQTSFSLKASSNNFSAKSKGASRKSGQQAVVTETSTRFGDTSDAGLSTVDVVQVSEELPAVSKEDYASDPTVDVAPVTEDPVDVVPVSEDPVDGPTKDFAEGDADKLTEQMPTNETSPMEESLA